MSDEDETIRIALDAGMDSGHDMSCDWTESGGRVECSCRLSTVEIGYAALDSLTSELSDKDTWAAHNIDIRDVRIANLEAELQKAKDEAADRDASLRQLTKQLDVAQGDRITLRQRAERYEKLLHRIYEDPDIVSAWYDDLRAALQDSKETA